MSDIEQRLARLEAQQALAQLPSRYALAVDSRDLDALVALFVPEVNCGKHWGRGREALKSFYAQTLSESFYRSQHFICGQSVALTDADHATGHTYCQAFHEDGAGWYVMAICYFDEYQRCDGSWLFSRRKELHWHAVDGKERPNDTTELTRWPRLTNAKYSEQLPQFWPSWAQFWQSVDPSKVAALTNRPVP